MRKPQRKRTRRHDGAATQLHARAAMPARPSARTAMPTLTRDPARIAAPWNALAGELYSFGSRRLRRVMDASSRCVAASSLDEMAAAQTQYVRELVHDYVDETGRVLSACVRALEDNLDMLRESSIALNDETTRSTPAALRALRRPSALAQTATVVQ
jgi:hypothetical protein